MWNFEKLTHAYTPHVFTMTKTDNSFIYKYFRILWKQD